MLDVGCWMLDAADDAFPFRSNPMGTRFHLISSQLISQMASLNYSIQISVCLSVWVKRFLYFLYLSFHLLQCFHTDLCYRLAILSIILLDNFNGILVYFSLRCIYGANFREYMVSIPLELNITIKWWTFSQYKSFPRKKR